VNVFPDLGYIAWAGSNSGREEEDQMVHAIAAALPFYSFIDCSSSIVGPSGDEGGDDDSLTGGQVAGIVIGAIAGAAMIGGAVVFYLHKTAESDNNEASDEMRRSLQP
jgi:hypothetical protein